MLGWTSQWRQDGWNTKKKSVIRNSHKILIVETQGNRPVGRPKRRQEENSEMILQNVTCEGVDCIHLAQVRGPMAGSCEVRNGPSFSIKDWKFLLPAPQRLCSNLHNSKFLNMSVWFRWYSYAEKSCFVSQPDDKQFYISEIWCRWRSFGSDIM